MGLYLTPAAISYLTQLVLALAITAYLGYRLRTADRRSQDTRSLRLVAGIFVTVTVLVTLLFGDAALAPTPRLYAVYGENTVIGVLLILLLQFAYAFPQRYPRRRWEARGALALSLVYTLWEAGFALYRGLWLLPLDQVMYRPHGADYAMALLFLCVPLAFLRQMTAAAPRTPARRALRGFALILLIPLGLSLLTLARDLSAIHPAVFQTSLAAGILLTQFLFAFNYLNALPALMSFQVRLVGITLLGVLAVFGAVGWALTPPHAAVYRPALADQQTLRFRPNAQGGYDVTPVAFRFDPGPGVPLAMEIPFPGGASPDALAAVPFTFSFYGKTVETLWVLQSGAVGMDAPLHVPSMQYHYAATPAIFPLFVTLDTASGGVFAKNEDDRLTLTWQGLRGWRDRQATYAFQLVLHRDGVFTITTNGLPDAPYEPNTSPFTNVWVTGATPGLRPRPAQQVNFAAGPLAGGPQGLLQDHYLEFRAHLHRLLAPLAVLILVSSIVVTLGFPIVFYMSLIRPLNALLAGVRRVKDGDLATTMPIQYRDEIGFLTESFNQAVAQQRDLLSTLETRVAERTADLTQANERLRHEMDERQVAQAHVVLQEHALSAAEEREQLGRDLHDGLGQVMGYLNLQAQTVETLLDQGQTEAVRTNLRHLAQAAQQAHTDVRSFILGFRAAARRSFDETLGETTADFARQTGIPATLEAAQPWDASWLSPVAEVHLLRIIQEALNNVRRHAQARHVTLALALAGDRLRVTVADDGVGFEPMDTSLRGPSLGPKQSPTSEEIASAHPSTTPAEHQQAPLRTLLAMTDQEHFGLATMRERAAQLCGSLTIESAPGQGTRVMLECPIQAPCEPSAPPVSPLRVLLVDDHPMFLDGLRNLLTAHGMEVVGLGQDGLEAQTLARALRPDLIVMDLQMPNCDGVEATRRIKAEWPEACIVILTVSAQEEHLYAALQAGAAGYLLKNLKAEEFFRLLAGLERGAPPIAPELAARIQGELGQATLQGEQHAALSPEESDLLRLVAQGLTYREVGRQLHLSEATIKYRMKQILERLHLANRGQAEAYARRSGLGG